MRTVVAAVPVALLYGCWRHPCGKPVRFPAEVYVSADEFASALDEDGDLSDAACAHLCRTWFCGELDELYGCAVEESPTDTGRSIGDFAVLECDLTGIACCTGGRRHAEIRTRDLGTGPTAVAAWLGGATAAEAASVKAFVAIARELRALGAPPTLVARCHAAARQEVVHARLLGCATRQRGGWATRPSFRPPGERTALAVARENIVEGCVRESWAAAIAAIQAKNADPTLRPAFARIAADEREHAHLAFGIHRWLLGRLTAEDRRAVTSAGRQALALLRQGVADPGAELAALGLPGREQARRVHRHVATRVLAARQRA